PGPGGSRTSPGSTRPTSRRSHPRCTRTRTARTRRRWSRGCWRHWTCSHSGSSRGRGPTKATYSRSRPLATLRGLRMNPARRSMAARIPALLLCGLLALAGCDRQAPAARGGGAAIPVTTAVVQPRPWSDTVQGLGTVRARESVTLTAKVSEIVEQVHFDSGQKVAAGQPLVTLRVDAPRAALLEAQAAADEAEQQFRRLQSLAGQQLVSRASLDTQRATRDAAVARVRQMQSDIGDRQVRAPFAGVLGIRQVSPGALLTPNAVIATLDDISRVYVDFQVPESALSRVATGATVSASGAAWPGREFEGQVQAVDARIDPQTRAVTVRAA